MTRAPEISVVIPYGYSSPDLELSLQSVKSEINRIEIIIVTNKVLMKDLIGKKDAGYRIVESNRVGRGYFCSAGLKVAQGAIVLFLHADTVLPKGWDQKIIEVMADTSVAGGGFTAQFRTDHWFVKRLSNLYNLFSLAIHELWGDRAIFLRRKHITTDINKIELPIMEDVEMSKIIRNNGRMLLLPEVVSTSALHFTIKGHFQHILEALFFRALYGLGFSAHRIYYWYYR